MVYYTYIGFDPIELGSQTGQEEVNREKTGANVAREDRRPVGADIRHG